MKLVLPFGQTLFTYRNTANLASTQTLLSLPHAFPYPGPFSPSHLDEQIGEFKEHLKQLGELRLKESPIQRAGEPGGGRFPGFEAVRGQRHMSQRQATPIQISNGAHGPLQPSPQRGHPLPPLKVNSLHEPRMESQSPIVAPEHAHGSTRMPEPRSSTVHSILNNDDASSQRSSIPPDSYPHRSTSESPASSNGPLTPGKTFPSMNGIPSPHLAGRNTMLHNRGPGTTAISNPTGSIDARKVPFLTDPGKGVPHPMEAAHGRSPPPTAHRPVYPYPHPTVIKAEDRRGSDASQLIPSQSNSPTTSMTSYGTAPGPGSRTSPVMPYSQSAPESRKGMGTPQQSPMGPSSQTYGPPSNGAASQGTYQLMTIDTDRGPVQFPVDVQAASKVADEKRKRNAGASARFRQRRKEKEREASQTISRLESKVRDLNDDKEFYRRERDYFRNLVYNSPVSSQVVARPPSPRQRKLSIDTSSAGTPEWQQNGERGNDNGQNQRRRISGFFEPAAGQSPVVAVTAAPPPPPSQAQGPPPHSHNPHAAYPTQQPAYGYAQDARTRHPPPPPPLRAGHYEAGVSPVYEQRPYFSSRV